MSFKDTIPSKTFVTRSTFEFDTFVNTFDVSFEAARPSETFVTIFARIFIWFLWGFFHFWISVLYCFHISDEIIKVREISKVIANYLILKDVF